MSLTNMSQASMSPTDQQLIADALSMHANFIETGNVYFSAAQAEQRNKTINSSSRIERRNVVPVNTLSQEQLGLVQKLRTLSSTIPALDTGRQHENIRSEMAIK